MLLARVIISRNVKERDNDVGIMYAGLSSQ